MINLVLMTLMIAALCGMVFCNRRHRKDVRFQVIALALLTVVIACGGLFMCRLDTHSLLGIQTDPDNSILDSKLRSAQGFVVANYIRTVCSSNGKVLLISPGSTVQLNQALLAEFHNAGLGRLIHEKITFPDSNPGDKLINPVADRAAETSSIDTALDRHPDARAVVIAGIAPSGASLHKLNVYKLPPDRRPRLIIIGLNNLTDWCAKMIRNGFFDAIVAADPIRNLPAADKIPENPVQLFDCCYVLITKDNLERNMRLFKSRK